MIKNIETRINLTDDSFIFIDQVMYSDIDKSGLVDLRGYIMNKEGHLIATLKEEIDAPYIDALNLIKKLKNKEIELTIIDIEEYKKIEEKVEKIFL
jgi:hypothetical protein